MKKIVNSLLAVALSLGIWSCANEQPASQAGPGDASLQFTMKAPTVPFVTRADIATANEWNIDQLDVYAGDKTAGMISKLVSGTDYTMVENTASHTFTITMKPSWMSTNQGKTVAFYFVGNDATSIGAIENDGVWGHDKLQFANPQPIFNDYNTNPLPDDDEYAAFDWQLDGADHNLLFTATAEIEINGTVKHTGHLKRRMARFDLVVEADMADDFVFSEVMVEGVPTQVRLFIAPEINNTGFQTYALVPAANLAYNAKNPTTATSNNAVEGAFYMYPTVMGTHTTITIFGEFNGAKAVYPVTVEAGTMVKPNYRYTLKLNPSTGEFDMIGDDWEEGESWSAEEGVNTEPALGSTRLVGDATADGWVCTVPSGAAGSGFELNLTSEFGTTYAIEYIAGGTAADNTLVVSKTKEFELATRATNGHVAEGYKFLTPAGTAPIYAKITIISFEGEGGKAEMWLKRLADGQVLYFGNDGKLSVANWDNSTVTMRNLAFFKFGSVIGFDNYYPVDTKWPADGSAIHFNPTKLVHGTDITAYAPVNYNTATSNALPYIPGYVKADYDANRRDISASDYATVANLKAGKGDPCKLIGYTGAQLAAMSDSELQAVLDNAAYRLPTRDENRLFTGIDNTSYTAHWTAGDGSLANPGVAKLPAVATDVPVGIYTLPESGWYSGIGYAAPLFNQGLFWSSSLHEYEPTIYGSFMNVTSIVVHPTSGFQYSMGCAIRCVPTV
jgi:hypothetical protein